MPWDPWELIEWWLCGRPFSHWMNSLPCCFLPAGPLEGSGAPAASLHWAPERRPHRLKKSTGSVDQVGSDQVDRAFSLYIVYLLCLARLHRFFACGGTAWSSPSQGLVQLSYRILGTEGIRGQKWKSLISVISIHWISLDNERVSIDSSLFLPASRGFCCALEHFSPWTAGMKICTSC